MKRRSKHSALLAVVVIIMAAAPFNLVAATNGFIVPPFRGAANTEAGYWENFSVPSGAPGNPVDQPGATTGASLTQTNVSAFLTGSGNIYNTSISSFIVEDATPFALGTVVLQTRTLGNELNYSSVSLTYSNDSGLHSIAPLFRYELNRSGLGPQGSAVSSLWQWELAGLGVSNYAITFVAGGTDVSFDSMTLDTSAPIGTNFVDSAAFVQQPFKLQSYRAALSRWSYLASDFTSGSRQTASVFGALGNAPDFDARDAQYLLAWSTTNRVPAAQGPNNYLIRRARVTLTISGNQYVYTGKPRDYRSYFLTNDPNYVPPATTAFPVELFGAGFRGGITNGESAFVPWAATNYPQTGPWAIGSDADYHEYRCAYSAGFDTNGVLVDVSNNVGDDGTNEIAAPFEVAPFAIGQTTNAAEGQVMPAHSQLTFDLNLDDPLIYGYVQRGLHEGTLSFMASSLVSGAQPPAPATYPAFYTIFSAIAAPGEFPLLDLDGEILRPNLDSDNDGLSDDWENFYFGSLATGAATDPDRDKLNNLAEYNAGTVPTAATSHFKMLSIQHATNSTEVHFTFAPGRQYNLRWSADLQNWQTVTNPPLAYSSAWLAKSETNPPYPSQVFAVWRATNATNQARYYRAEAH